MGRRLRSHLDRQFPELSQRVEKQQVNQARQHDNAKRLRSFQVDDPVYVKDFSTPHDSWIPGKVTKVTDPVSYHIEVQPGGVVRRHMDAVRQRTDTAAPLPQPQEVDTHDCLEDIYLPDIPASRPIVAPPNTWPTSKGSISTS